MMRRPQIADKNPKDELQRKFSFTEQEATNIIRAVGSQRIVNWLLEKFMHVKGFGLTRNFIYGFVMYKGEEIANLDEWQKFSSLAKEPNLNGDVQRTLLAYKANLTGSQVSTMKAEDLTEAKLKVLAQLRSF